MFRFRTLAALAFGVVLATPAWAQPSTSASVTATLTVPTVLHIAVSGSSVTFTGDYAAFEAGYAAGSGTTVVSHRGNVRHSVSLASNAASFTGSAGSSTSDPVSTTKPASDLRYAVGTGTFSAISTTATEIHNQAARGSHINDETVSYRVALAYADDTPGTYTLGLTYTVAAD